jgi:hypothetical protein
MQYQRPIWAETCSNDNTCLNKGHADIVAYKGVFIYFLQKTLLRTVVLRKSISGYTRNGMQNPAINYSITFIKRKRWKFHQLNSQMDIQTTVSDIILNVDSNFSVPGY